MRKKPYTAEEFFNEIIKDIPVPDIVEYASPSSRSRRETLLTNYQFDIYTRVMYGTNEGVYADVMISGSYDIEPNAPDLCIGVIKTLNRDDESVKKIYEYCSEIFLKGTKFLNDNLDDFTWLGYRIEFSPNHRVEVKNEEAITNCIASRIRWGTDVSYVKLLNLATRKYEDAESYVKEAKERVEEGRYV